MKRKLLSKTFLKQTLLAVPAAALMLGAAQAGTTIGLNIQTWTYADGGKGYQTTGFPVTTKAFGVEAFNWVSPAPFYAYAAVSTNVVLGTATARLEATNPWQTGIGELNWGLQDDGKVGDWVPQAVAPGNDEVTWGMLDNTGWSVGLSGLNAAFPNGYVIQGIAAGKVTANSRVEITDGVAWTNSVAFNPIYTAGTAISSGPVGLQVPTPTLTSDVITMSNPSRDVSGTLNCALAGFIITDKPVVSRKPVDTTVNQGAALSLPAGAIGVGTLSYQWRLNGTPISNATNADYYVASASAANAGNYDLVVTNLYGSGTSVVASVTVVAVPSITVDLTGITGTLYAGANFSQWNIVAAGGLPLHYQWLKNGTIPVGLNSPVLTLSNLAVSASGSYSVTVTNLYGSAKSATNHLVVLAAPDIYTTDVAQDTPSAYWPLNETSGNLANDYSGLGHIGTNTDSLTLGVPGPRPPSYQGFQAGKTAYQFDGASTYVDFGTGPSLSGTNDFTLEAWINTTAVSDGVIVQQRSGFDGEYMFTVTAGGALSFMLYGGGYQFSFSTTTTVNDGNWHHVVAVRNGTNGFIYVDGTLAASANGPVRPLNAAFTTVIGRDQRDLKTYFNGSISDVAIYPVALSAHRIALHAYNGWFANAPFYISTTPGGYVADSKPVGAPHAGVNHNATWTNAITDTASPPVTRNGVEVFTGNSQITVPANPDFDCPTGTILFWLRANAPIPGPGLEGAMLVDRRTTNGTVIVLNDAGSVFVQCADGANTFAAGYLPDDNWHLVAVTYDQSATGAVEIFVDGISQGSQPNSAAWAWPAGQPLEIGRSHDGYWKRFNGQMDDFRIYSRILTASEIATIQTSDALVDTAALKVRYNFDTAGAGLSLTWPVGTLESSPALGASAAWTPVTNATPPYPFLPPESAPIIPTLFYRAGF